MSTPPPPWPPQPGSPSPYGAPAPPQSNGTLILVLGILSIVLCGCGVILGPVAWIMGNSSLAAINSGSGNPSELGSVNAGRICGIVGTILSALYIIGYGSLIALGIVSGIHHPGGSSPF